MLNVSKEDLLKDFEDAPETVKSGLYKLVYSNEYGVFGGKPYGLLCGDYDFGPGGQDMDRHVLEQAGIFCAAVVGDQHYAMAARLEFGGERMRRDHMSAGAPGSENDIHRAKLSPPHLTT